MGKKKEEIVINFQYLYQHCYGVYDDCFYHTTIQHAQLTLNGTYSVPMKRSMKRWRERIYSEIFEKLPDLVKLKVLASEQLISPITALPRNLGQH